MSAVAQYWCSRMVWSEEEQCYHIRGTSEWKDLSLELGKDAQLMT